MNNREKNGKNRLNFGSIGIAAALIALMGGIWLFPGKEKPTPDQLFAQYHQVYPNIATSMQRSANGNMDAGKRAFFLYEKEQFDLASQAFSRLLQQQPKNVTYQFYRAQSDLNAGSYESALAAFQEVLDKGPQKNRYFEAARWYVALASLKTNDIEQAKTFLQKLRNGDSKYVTSARALLNDLGKDNP